MTEHPLRRRRLAALLAGAVVPLALLAGIALPTSIGPTEAGWTRHTQVSAQAEAAVVPAPTLTGSCRFRSYLLYSEVEIYWQLPPGYTMEDVVVEASSSGLGSVLEPLTGFDATANTEENDDGTLTTEVNTNLLGGLLGLGSELEIAIAVEDAGGWTSESASIATNAGLVGGIGGSCRNLT